MPMTSRLTTVGQGAGLALLGLIAGSLFGIRFGFDFTQYSPSTYLEVHQLAVHGLNDLLPMMGLAALLVIAVLAFHARANRRALVLYLLAGLGVIVAGLVTRFLNQPINSEVMTWSTVAMPADWDAIRHNWWTWHAVRLAASAVAFAALIGAVFTERS